MKREKSYTDTTYLYHLTGEVELRIRGNLRANTPDDLLNECTAFTLATISEKLRLETRPRRYTALPTRLPPTAILQSPSLIACASPYVELCEIFLLPDTLQIVAGLGAAIRNIPLDLSARRLIHAHVSRVQRRPVDYQGIGQIPHILTKCLGQQNSLIPRWPLGQSIGTE